MRLLLGCIFGVLFYLAYWFLFLRGEKRSNIETMIFRLKWDYVVGFFGGCLAMSIGG